MKNVKEREEQKHNPNFKNAIVKTPEKLPLVTNYHKSSILQLWSDPDKNLKAKSVIKF